MLSSSGLGRELIQPRIDCAYAKSDDGPGGHDLHPVTRIPLSKLSEVYGEAQSLLADHTLDTDIDLSANDSGLAYFIENAQAARIIPTIDAQDISRFRALWSSGIPMIVDVSENLAAR